jgi:hypothetical protein
MIIGLNDGFDCVQPVRGLSSIIIRLLDYNTEARALGYHIKAQGSVGCWERRLVPNRPLLRITGRSDCFLGATDLILDRGQPAIAFSKRPFRKGCISISYPRIPCCPQKKCPIHPLKLIMKEQAAFMKTTESSGYCYLC